MGVRGIIGRTGRASPYRAGLAVHCIVDNLATHGTEAVEFNHTSDLATAILDYNNRAEPFKWTHHPNPDSQQTHAREH